MIMLAATTIDPRRTPCESSHPPAMLPGAFTSTISAVSSDASVADAPRSSTRNVGSQIITDAHCET